MINSFRKKRKKMADDNKTLKYLRYAIGEIVLVVVGILIALQINNWNEDRKIYQKELIIVGELYEELQQNLIITIHHKNKIKLRNEEVLYLLNISSDSLNLLTDAQLAERIFKSGHIGTFSPLNQKLNSVLSLENFEFSHSKVLLNDLQNYTISIHNIITRNNDALGAFRNSLVPFLSKRISIKNIMHYANPDLINKSENFSNDRSVIKSIGFENLYADLFASGSSNATYLNENIELISNLLGHIEEKYPSIISNLNND